METYELPSAADQTKLALLSLYSSETWKKLGGRMLVPVHDELLAEVPMRNWKEGGEELSRCMRNAASFLPYPSKCDVTTSMRWYGLEYPCKYTMPCSFSFDSLTEDEIKYIQYCLVEMEYLLPVFKGEDGKKPKGDPGFGVNGIITEEFKNAVVDYMHRYSLSYEQFVPHITNNVFYGIKTTERY